MTQKAIDYWIQGEKYLNSSCCSTPNYESAVGLYSRAYTLYKFEKNKDLAIKCSDKIVLCHSKLNNLIGICVQLENLIDYLSTNHPESINKIKESVFKCHTTYKISSNNINACYVLIKYFKYLNKIKNSDADEHLQTLDLIISITESGMLDLIYKKDIYVQIYKYIVKYYPSNKYTNFINDIIDVCTKLNQLNNVYNIMLSDVVYWIGKYNLQASRNNLQKYYSVSNFITTEQCELARQLIFLFDEVIVESEFKTKFSILINKMSIFLMDREIYNLISKIQINKLQELAVSEMYNDLC
jgi:hypothetical protein